MDQLLTLYDSEGQLPCVKPWKCDKHDEFDEFYEENKNLYSIKTRGAHMIRKAGAYLIGRATHE